jgi:sugar O-acyltransferase (sialic acid O-acetyltransferase NeuD family)
MNKKGRILILGAGGFGREVLHWTNDWLKNSCDWEIEGFIDDNLNALDNLATEKRVVSTISGYVPTPDTRLVVAIADPKTKLKLCRELLARGAKFVSIVHPSAIIVPGAVVGVGCMICPRVTITDNVKIGDFVTINVGSGVGHDSSLADGVTVSAMCDITGGVTVEEGVFFGSNATILPRQRIGSFAKIGAGSVVLRGVDANSTVFGNPAKRIL